MEIDKISFKRTGLRKGIIYLLFIIYYSFLWAAIAHSNLGYATVNNTLVKVCNGNSTS